MITDVQNVQCIMLQLQNEISRVGITVTNIQYEINKSVNLSVTHNEAAPQRELFAHKKVKQCDRMKEVKP